MSPDSDVQITRVYWIRFEDQESAFLNERQFLKLFPDKSESIKQYIKKNKLGFEKLEDVIQIVNYCATLS